MRRALTVLALILMASALAWAQGAAQLQAVLVVESMMDAMGGPAAWEKARYLRFDWVVERDAKEVAHVKHLWDRYDGRYRVEWETRDHKKVVALFNVNSRVGKVHVDGHAAEGEELPKYLEQAYGRFINDSYWLLMPWKLKDPGVKLEYVKQTEMEGKKYDVLHVSFEQVGLTPGDHYWAFINRETHLMDRWAYFLESYVKDKGEPALDKATPWDWRDWRDVGGLKLACEKVRVGENARIHFPVLKVLTDVDVSVFESFEAHLPGGE
ncbi:MAG TPA: DUF6503 family protein [Candidatus Xenobia bacterium]|nr:DUF6503 family protein [Candidatus Xenobia bacterium]